MPCIAVDIDLSKAHAKISVGLTNDQYLKEAEKIKDKESWLFKKFKMLRLS